MDIRIGLADSPRELSVELPDGTEADDIIKQVEATLTKGGVLWLTDSKDRRIAIRGERINYVDVGSSSGPRMGFGS